MWTAADGMVDLGTLGGAESFAYDINNVGQVVGVSDTADTPSGRHLFLWTAAAGMVDIGWLGGGDFPYHINNAGQVVGTRGSRAFLWTATGGAIDISDDGACGIAINNVGQVVVDWSPSASWTWLPSSPGSYHVQVWVRNVGSGAVYDAVGDADLTMTAPAVLQAGLGSDRTFPVPAGTPVTWTARGIGGTAPYSYKFWVFDGSTWSMGRDWSPAATWTWIPAGPGSYFVQTWIRNAGSSNETDAWTGTAALSISSATAVPVATVTVAPMSPLFAGVPAVVTATATGGSGPYTYQFWVYDGSAWTIGQAWSAANTFTWQPPAAGTY